MRRKMKSGFPVEIICIGAVIIFVLSMINNFSVASASDYSSTNLYGNYSSNTANKTRTIQTPKSRFSDVNYLWPVPERKNVTSGFGLRIVNGQYGNHLGIDIGGGGKEGFDIVAVEDGEVTFSGNMGTYGKVIFIKHPDGNETRYAHNRALLVKEGEKVKKGQKIAEMGNTGRSYGAHLHFEIRVDGKPIDPLQLLPDYKEIPTETLYKAKVSDDVIDLNIRSTISYTSEYNIISIVPSGTELEVLREDNHPRKLDKSISVLVRTPEGKIGYCKKSYLKKI